MIVLCADGKWYRNPIWRTDKLVVRAGMELEVAYRTKRPVRWGTIAKALIGLKLHAEMPTHLLPETETHPRPNAAMWNDRLEAGVTFTDVKITKGRPLVPDSSEGMYHERPSYIEDEFLELEPYRQRVGSDPRRREEAS